MKKFISITAVLIFILSSVNINAQALISAKDLSVKMKDKNCIVISAEKADKFNKVHIKGAVNIPYSDLNSSSFGKLKSSSAIATIFGNKGVSNTNMIVVYDEGKGKYAGRMYWVLKYLGCKDVKILNGGYKSWYAARKPYSKTTVNLPKATFTAKLNYAYSAKLSDVKSGKYLIVDVRPLNEFDGSSEKSQGGHIPGAINFPYTKVLSGSGKLKSKTELLSLFKAAGITSDKKIILYCKTSTRAGIVFLALKSILSYPTVKVYDGALNEWVKANKVEK
ncbi:MAG: sulfurtransferase [Bacteroidales bacterium]|nr:sulfurtransferase [Bacteroidales bacterium]